MPVVILCGGLGTRLSEVTHIRPKPMVEIGDMPILWHIMRTYSKYEFDDFIIALGYKGDAIKDFFLNYTQRNSSKLDVCLKTGKINYKHEIVDNWNVSLCETGKHSLTGGRLHRLMPYLKSGTFMLTYGDGVSDIDIARLLKFHKSHNKIATVTAVRPPARFGTMTFQGDQVVDFQEKPQTGEGWINGGFFVFEPEIFDYLDGDSTILEHEPLERLASDRQLMAYKHEGFWQPMDTLRDKNTLNDLWKNDCAPWKV